MTSVATNTVATRVVVQPARSRRERSEFLHFPWKLYRGDPNWIPPLRYSQQQLVGYKRHPFHDDAEVQTFVAYRQGAPCGRIAAIVNRGHNRQYREQRGFFGFFESIDDQDVANALFDAAQTWLADRGMQAMRGPTNPSLNYECGLLVEGFDSPPTFMMTYNPPYYGRLMETYGFSKVEDMYAFWGHVEMLSSLDHKLEFVVREATSRFNIVVRPMDKSRMAAEMQAFLKIYNESLVNTWGFVPMSAGEVRQMGVELKHLIVPDLAVVGEVDGKPIGVSFALLDYNPLIKEIDGRLFPFGFLKLLRGRRRIKRVRILSTNVLPEYQRWGVGLVLVNGLVPKVLDWGITEGEFSWVLESNHLSRRTLEKGGAKRTKTYRIYDYEF
jgi:GNAT superfamily N-acetyltransferase